MKYVSNVYLMDGKPHASVTAVETRGNMIHPVSKTDGWVEYKDRIYDTESDARIAAISQIDVLVARLENLRETLVKKVMQK